MPPDALVLGFDTSAAHCAAALLSGNRVLVARIEPMAKGQAERLMPMLEEILAEAGVGWRDLTALGVGTGPGNFTGVRIAVSAARGLALGLAIRAVGVSVLDAIALGAARPVLCSLDARRGQFYLQYFDSVDGFGPILTGTVDPLPLPKHSRPLCLGDAADTFAARTGGGVGQPVYPLAEAIARLAAERRHHISTRPAPLYLRAADAALPTDRPPVILP